MRFRIALVLLSIMALALGILRALLVSRAHNIQMPVDDPFFIFLLPAAILIALAALSLAVARRQLRIASVVLVGMMALASVVKPVLLEPLAISLVGVAALNLVQGRGRDGAD